MFTFVLWKGTEKTVPTHGVWNMAQAVAAAKSGLKNYTKIQIMTGDKVVQEFINPNTEG